MAISLSYTTPVYLCNHLTWLRAPGAFTAVPFRVSFNQPSMGMAFWLESMMDVYFIVDLALNFVTGYEDDGATPNPKPTHLPP